MSPEIDSYKKKRWNPISFVIGLVVIAICFAITQIESEKLDREFYASEIKGVITEEVVARSVRITVNEKNYSFYTNSVYIHQESHDFGEVAEVLDSVSKDANSNSITLYHHEQEYTFVCNN